MEWLILAGFGWVIYKIMQRINENSGNNNVGAYYSIKQATHTPKPQLNVKQVDISDIKLSPEQKELFEKLEHTNKHIFITGKAGTGKSMLLQYFKQNSSKRLVVVAPTGVAALNVRGQTIHSLFRIRPGFNSKENLRINSKTALLLKNLDAVVIDEVSMVRADLMDSIDYILRKTRSNNLSFGGVQMIMFGDLYQLPPVIDSPELHKYFADNHGGFYFFNALAWKNIILETYELTTIFRQKDEDFKNILNTIRTGQIDVSLLSQLNQRVEIEIPSNGVITLATTNQSVNEINESQLSQLKGKIFEYKATIIGDIKPPYPTEETLRLKKGAQIMLMKNDKEKRWVNGTLGYVDSLTDKEIKVNVDGIIYPVPQETWNKISYYYNRETHKIEEEIISSFTQFPLRLAWAITVHKSQGQTYGSVVVDMGDGAFAHGQTYVALSRCKSLDGLFLKREILREDIIVDPSIITFMNKTTVLDVLDTR